MHPKVQSLIHRVNKAGGRIVFEEDFDDFLEIERLCQKEADVSTSAIVELQERPVIIGETLLYRLSWGAREWLRTSAAPWFGDTYMGDMAVAWAMAHSSNKTAITARMLVDKRHAIKTINAWAKTVTEPWDVVLEAVKQLMPAVEESFKPEDAKRSNSVPTSPVTVLARLIAEYGHDEDHWLYEISEDRLDAYLRAMIDDDRKNLSNMAALAGKDFKNDRSEEALWLGKHLNVLIKAALDKCVARGDTDA